MIDNGVPTAGRNGASMVGARDIGLALSGGGFRAAAFHLGCLRALHDIGLLSRVRVASGISGGALLVALWAYGPSDFAEFDKAAVSLLRRGLQHSIALRALAPAALARNLTTATATFASVLLARAARRHPPARLRSANRTDALVAALAGAAFGRKVMSEVTDPGLDVVLTATDLRTGAAVRFGSATSGCSRYGRIREPVTVSMAVAASAAYPLLLPALEREFVFTRGGEQRAEPVLLSDGGVYDNLGLSVLTPGRSPSFTDHVYNVPYIISCDAGRGLLAPAVPHFLASRAARAFEITHQRAQDIARARLHEWQAAGRVEGFVMAYLGMRDERLPVPLADLVPRQAVADYPTNFAAMTGHDIDTLATRGEQLIRTLIPRYCPQLTGPPPPAT